MKLIRKKKRVFFREIEEEININGKEEDVIVSIEKNTRKGQRNKSHRLNSLIVFIILGICALSATTYSQEKIPFLEEKIQLLEKDRSEIANMISVLEDQNYDLTAKQLSLYLMLELDEDLLPYRERFIIEVEIDHLEATMNNNYFLRILLMKDLKRISEEKKELLLLYNKK